jgi:hypothetical protein
VREYNEAEMIKSAPIRPICQLRVSFFLMIWMNKMNVEINIAEKEKQTDSDNMAIDQK